MCCGRDFCLRKCVNSSLEDWLLLNHFLGFLSCLCLPLCFFFFVWHCCAWKGGPPKKCWHSQTYQTFRQKLHWMEMKTGKCTREACLRVKARASLLQLWIQRRADDINSNGEAESLGNIKRAAGHHTQSDKSCRCIVITCVRIWKILQNMNHLFRFVTFL